MNATMCLETNQWLKTSAPVMALDSSIPADKLSILRSALHEGVSANPDPSRSGFYDVEIDGVRHERAAWSYEAPLPAMQQVAHRFGFWNDVKVG